MALDYSGLNNVFRALVINRILYALPVFYGGLSQHDKERVNALFKKGKRWGVTNVGYDLDLLAVMADSGLAKKTKICGHCLYPIVPKIKHKSVYNLRPRSSQYETPRLCIDKLKNSFINRNFN